jgi:hypothetical protein
MTMLMNIWVRDKESGTIHQVGTDVHDGLELLDGKVEYYNIQNGCGTLGGVYEFVEAPDLDDYIRVTPEQLYLNRELVHEELLKMLKESESK